MYRPRAYVPLEQGGLLKEYEYLTTAVTLWDVATERQIQIKGPDAVAFANLLATRDLTKKFSVGQARFALLCYDDGNILNDPIIFHIAEDEVWLSTHTEVVPWARGVLYKSGHNVSVYEIDVSPVQIQGPKSGLLMEKLVRKGLIGEEVLDLKYYHICRTKLSGLDVAVSRTGFSSEFGYEVYLYDSIIHADTMWDTIWDAGQEFGLQVIAPSHIRSLEAGMLWYGIDIDPETNPFEVGLDNIVDLDKPDFIGKEALMDIKRKGVSQKIVGLTMEGKPQLWYNADFWLVKDATGRENVGYVTRAFYSPKLRTNIAHAMVMIEHAAIGTSLKVAMPDEKGLVAATVVNRPFYDPKKEIPLIDTGAASKTL
jgi:aminomethyltransferase